MYNGAVGGTPRKITVPEIRARKTVGPHADPKADRISMITAYDFTMARLVDAAGIDIKGSSAGGDWRLPTPGTFVLDTDGIVLLASVDGDFRRRAEPAQLLAALDARRS